MPSNAPARDPLILRLLLQIIRPDTEQIRVHRWVAFLASFLFSYLLWGKSYFTDWRIFLGVSTVVLTAGALSTIITAAVVGWTHSRYPEPTQTRQRLLCNCLGLMLMGAIITTVFMWSFNTLHLFGYRYNPRLGPWILALALLFDIALAGIFEISFAFRQWQRSQLEAEQLTQQQLQRQLNDMKERVNPHFLFNSLSSLSVLISEDPGRAERFVDEMAQVYRYLLQAHRSGQRPGPASLVPLEAELRFLRSYGYLLSTRYGAGLELTLAPSEAYPPGTLLPLTLQTLVDNAIRHNVLSAGRPLRIVVEPAGWGVRVRNTVQKRPQRVPLSREGLASLQAHYQLLGAGYALRVVADDASFGVTVPLLPA